MDNAKVSDILSSDTLEAIHVLTKTSTIDQALNVMYKHQIHSMPIIDFESNCLGLLDVLDILTYLVRVAKQQGPATAEDDEVEDLDKLFQRANQFNLGQVDQQINISTRNPFLPCTKGAPLIEVLKVFATGVHRVPIVRSEDPNQIVAMLTQSDVNAFISTDPSIYLVEKAKMSLKELDLIVGEDNVVSVTANTKTIDAFVKMHEKHLSDVAIVDEDGTFQGCLSASDLTLIKDYKFNCLLWPVLQFLGELSNEEGGQHARSYIEPRGRPGWCLPSTSLGTVVKKLAQERMHRIFVVNDQKKVVGVVSLTDIARIATKGH